MNEHANKRQVRFALVSLMTSILGAAFACKALQLSFHIENTEAALAEAQRGALFATLAACWYVLAVALGNASGARGGLMLAIGSPVVLGLLPLLLVPENVIPFGTTLLSAVVSFAACFVNVGLRISASRLDKTPDQR